MTVAAIFDLDGTIVDTHALHLRAWHDLGAETGTTLDDRELTRWFGRRAVETVQAIWLGGRDDAGAIREAERLTDRKESIFRALASSDLPTVAGAVELVERLHAAGIPLAIGSSAPAANIELCLELLGIGGRFVAVVAGESVRVGKPDPDVFLRAADALGAAPQACVVFEDAPAGVEAAHRAGMACVAVVSTGRSRGELADAEVIVGDLTGIDPDLVRELAAGRLPPALQGR